MVRIERKAGHYKVIAHNHGNDLYVEFESDPAHVLSFTISPNWDIADTSEAFYDISGWGEDVLECISEAFAGMAGLPERCEWCYERHAEPLEVFHLCPKCGKIHAPACK